MLEAHPNRKAAYARPFAFSAGCADRARGACLACLDSTAALLAVVDRGFRQCGIGMAKISALLDQVIEGRGVIKFRHLERLLTALGSIWHARARAIGSTFTRLFPAL